MMNKGYAILVQVITLGLQLLCTLKRKLVLISVLKLTMY